MSHPVDVEVYENQAAVFEVEVSGKPAPELKWFRGLSMLKSTNRLSIESVGNVRRLILNDCQLSDAGTFTVRASSRAGEQALEANLIVKGLQK